jgi:ABC-type amino acid transport substrate-binding protein
MPTLPAHRRPVRWILIAAAMAASASLAGCSAPSGNTASSASSASSAGVLLVGSDLTYPPYDSLDGAGKPAGFDPNLVQALASQLGVQPQFKDTRFAQLIVGLKSGQFDMIASALYITSERAKQVDYIPYFSTGNSIVTRSGGAQPATAADLCGKSVGVIAGGDIVQRLRSDASKACTAAGKQPVDVREFPSDPEATQALLAGQVDVQVTDAAVAKSLIDKMGGRLTISSRDLLYPVPVGLAVRKGNTQLADRIKAALDKLRASGQYATLLAKYNLKEPDPAQIANILGS